LGTKGGFKGVKFHLAIDGTLPHGTTIGGSR